MTEIQLTRGYVTVVDDCDADLAAFKWHATSTKEHQLVYAKHQSMRMHRVIMERVLGRPLLRGELVDHWDNNGLNNTRNNLRVATVAQNRSNSRAHKNNKSGFKGVSRVSQSRRWLARIRVNNELIHLGNFDTPEEAHTAYVEAAKKYHGEFWNAG